LDPAGGADAVHREPVPRLAPPPGRVHGAVHAGAVRSDPGRSGPSGALVKNGSGVGSRPLSRRFGRPRPRTGPPGRRRAWPGRCRRPRPRTVPTAPRPYPSLLAPGAGGLVEGQAALEEGFAGLVALDLVQGEFDLRVVHARPPWGRETAQYGPA